MWYEVKRKMTFAAMVTLVLIFSAAMVAASGIVTEAHDNQVVEVTAQRIAVEYIPEPTNTPITRAVVEVLPTPTPMMRETPAPSIVPEKIYTYYDVPLDDELQEYIQDVCEELGFERYDIIIALIGHESSYRQTVVSRTNDYGYMQINECNHEWLGEELGITDILDAEQNILAGVYMLDDYVDRYGDIGLALMCYNCGEYGAQQLWEQGIYSTRYSREVQDEAERLEERQEVNEE